MPEALAEQPAVGRLAGVYWERLQSLLDGPEIIESEEDERRVSASSRGLPGLVG